MNSVYFVCPKCQHYIEPGYRWAYATLQKTGIVQLGQAVKVDQVLGCADYWNVQPDSPDENLEWLVVKTLPQVKEFLSQHQAHGIQYWDEDFFANDSALSWKRIPTCF